MNHENPWLALIISLPTRNATARMRIWRALKTLGCAVLRDGVYLLPDIDGAHSALQLQAAETLTAGGTAHLVRLDTTDSQQAEAYMTLFDRTADYAALKTVVAAWLQTLTSLDAPSAKRSLHRLKREYDAIVATDYFPGAASTQLAAELAHAEAAYRAYTQPGEPQAVTSSITHLQRADYQQRTWATRQRPWIDRLASAWLIQRFIDAQPHFIWLAQPYDCPPNALGFDFDGATFSHVGARVTFEVLLASFGLEQDSALMRIGALVHYLDIGGVPVSEAAGLELVFKALQTRHTDDDTLLFHACALLDDLYQAFSPPPETTP